MKNKFLLYGIVIVAIFITYVLLKKYLINQIFAKGILEDSPINRQGLANQNILQIIQTSKQVRS